MQTREQNTNNPNKNTPKREKQNPKSTKRNQNKNTLKNIPKHRINSILNLNINT